MIGSIYFWGQGVAVDYRRAMAAYKVGAAGVDAECQYQIGTMYYNGHGVDVDYAQALPWFEKAAAQDYPKAVGSLADMYTGQCGAVTPSLRRARELYRRAIELGSFESVKAMQDLNTVIQAVMNEPRKQPLRPAIRHSCVIVSPTALSPPRTRSSVPSWTSGWRSTARAGPT